MRKARAAGPPHYPDRQRVEIPDTDAPEDRVLSRAWKRKPDSFASHVALAAGAGLGLAVLPAAAPILGRMAVGGVGAELITTLMRMGARRGARMGPTMTEMAQPLLDKAASLKASAFSGNANYVAETLASGKPIV